MHALYHQHSDGPFQLFKMIIIQQILLFVYLFFSENVQRVINSVRLKGSEGATASHGYSLTVSSTVATQEGPCSCSSSCPKPPFHQPLRDTPNLA